MNPIIQKRYDKAGPRVAAALSRRNMEAFYCPTAIEGVQKVLELIAPEDVVSWGGAMTADEMNLKELLRRRGQPVIDRDTAATPAERQELMRKALTCDTFLMSSNAISEDGQLVNIDGNGNRVAALCFGPRRVIVVAGMNKVVGTLDDRRARESPALRRQDSLQHDRLLRRLRQPPVQLRADRRHTLFHEPQPHQGRSGGRKSRPVRHKKEESALKTLLLRPDTDPQATQTAADILRRGGLVGIPTETVYGLGANALDGEAVRHIFEAKGRPQDNPLIIHVPDASWLERYCHDVPPQAYLLAERFWPGPLTMILPCRDIVPAQTTAGLPTVGVRCPNHPATLRIIAAAGVPIAAPSGNTSGRPSPTTAQHMLEDMDGKIDAIVDGGSCAVGVESTIIDLTVTPPRLLRPGGLPLESLRAVLGEVTVDRAVTGQVAPGEKPRAPGMKYRHYAPKAPVTVVTGPAARSADYIRCRIGENAGVICFDEFAPLFSGHIIHRLGPADDKLAQAQHVFDALRTFDGTSVAEIWAQSPDDGGLGLAVANRLKKAAGFHVADASPLLLGITGPTGAGKTSALRALEKLGACVLDCDAVYHEQLRSDAALRGAITDAFGDVFGADGLLDRQKLGNIVFSDPAALEKLNTIIYAHLPRALRQRADASGADVVALDAINLIESGLGALCRRTVAVLAPADVRAARIMARDGIPEEYARLRIAAQKNDDFYRAHCTDVLWNDAPTSEIFERQAGEFFGRLLQELQKGE